jgi:pantoate kinase
MEEARAFAPCHITGFFQIFDDTAKALDAGSKGAGVSLSLGVETLVEAKHSDKNRSRIYINDVLSEDAIVSEHVLHIFGSRFKEMTGLDIVVEHRTELKLGAGLGTSGAAALSLALALNEAYSSGLSKTEAAQVAHEAEVECKTGLGTVIAETFGGAEIRIKPGAPGIGKIRQIEVPQDTKIACLVFGPLSTRKLLSDFETRKRVNELGGKLVDRLVEDPSIVNLMELSRQFAEHVGLITDKVRNVLNLADNANFVCSMPMFGESVFTLTQQGSLQELLKIFREQGMGGRVIVSDVDFEGARVLK